MGAAERWHHVFGVVSLAMEKAVICYGCGKDITEVSRNRNNMLGPSFTKALPIWKRLVSARFNELNIADIDINLVLHDDEFVGKCCRLCTSALQRLDKLQSGICQNINKAVERIMNSDRWLNLSSRKRSLPSDSDEQLGPSVLRVMPSMSVSLPCSDERCPSPDVAVSY